ncbi:MAG: penicillin-binding transpeptidase domain-containing protein [Ruminococcus sp.]|nr:penicillin-binding transpeptidase domain-containing protein [Ruminococcus sp.]
MSYQPTNKMRIRLNLFILPVFLAFAGWIIVSLFKTSVTENNKYQAMANENQFKSTTVKANRGSIFDTNGKILAQSATVYSICVNPRRVYEQQVAEEKSGAAEDGETVLESKRMVDAAATILSEELNVTYDFVVGKLKTDGSNTQQWAQIAKSIEKPVYDKIMERAAEENLGDLIYPELDTKRYYPQAELAASVIGFTNFDGDGVYGVESYYNEYLKGVDGKIISARDGYGNEMPYKNDKMYESQDGNSVYLTIDMTLQYYVEKYLTQQVQAHQPAERACAIMMNAKTGAIYAMATVPGYDLNDKNSIYDANAASYLSGIVDEEEYNEQYAAKREQQWKNKAVSELYYPGSVFKVVTGSAALEEKAISLNSTFDCGGVMQVADIPFGCWASYSHGTQDFTTAMTNSCNPAFIQIGQRLGKDKFFEYFKAFGFTERTGIDLPGEADSIYTNTSEKGPVELASSSFGQTNTVTPIQMITAYAAVVNGGYLVTPYVVSKIVDPNGNIVKTTEPSIKRQVISEETSAMMREVLESVVNTKGGSNAYIKGYNIGGKSGTSQKQDLILKTGNEDLYVPSYCAFAPADDPEIIMLVMLDQPTAKDQNGALMYYGSVVAVPAVVNTLKEALPYLGYYPEYTQEELDSLGVTLPSVEGESVSIAKETLETQGLQVTVIGDGDKVTAQVPVRGSQVPRNGKVILYTDEGYETEYTTVPNIIGRSLSEVNTILTNANLNFKVGDGASNQAGAVAYSQNYAEGDEVPVGTIIEVIFVTKDQG